MDRYRHDRSNGMILVGHWLAEVAELFGLLGALISLIVGLLWAREGARGFGQR